MATTREQAFEALRVQLDAIFTATTFKVPVSRVWKHWDAVPATEQPRLFIVETPNEYSQDRGSPALRRWTCDLVLYAQRGAQPDVVMSTILNPLLEAIEAAVKPSAVSGVNDLGGLVSHAWINRNDIYEGTFGDQAVVIIPFEIMPKDDANAPGTTFIFGAGALFVTPLRKQGGGAPPLAAPLKMANLKGVRIEPESELIIQGSQLEYPVAAARGVTRIKMTAQIGTFDGLVVNEVFFGREHVAGATLADVDRSATVPATPGPYTIAVLPPSSGTFSEDLGVIRASNGVALVKVAASPAAGQYAVSGNVYTFNAAEQGVAIAVSYLYTVTTGSKMQLDNAFKGLAPTFRAVLQGEYNGRKVTWIFSNCTTARFAVPTQVESFAIMEFEFEALSDSNGNLGTLSNG